MQDWINKYRNITVKNLQMITIILHDLTWKQFTVTIDPEQ